MKSSEDGHVKILLVDDSPISQLMVSAMLESLEERVDLAENGRDALACLTRRRYGLVLMDCDMPVLDGCGATRLIREQEKFRGTDRVPVVGITGTEEDLERCLASGMDEGLLKPFNLDDLRSCLRRWLPERIDGCGAS